MLRPWLLATLLSSSTSAPTVRQPVDLLMPLIPPLAFGSSHHAGAMRKQFASNIGKRVSLIAIRAIWHIANADSADHSSRGFCIAARPDGAIAPWGCRPNGRLLLEHGASENRSSAQGGVEGIERYRGHQ